jgi:hypothetical protein
MRLRLIVLAGLLAMLGVTAVPSRAATPVPTDFYGTWYDALSHESAQNTPVLDDHHAIGIGAIRQYMWWNRMETSPGVFDWRRMDEVVRDTTARGVSIIPTLLYTPDFYSSKPPGATGSTQYPPTDPNTMAAYATALIKRYGPRGTYWCPPVVGGVTPPPVGQIIDGQVPCDDSLALRTWEVWNEPDYPSWWKGHPDASEYAALLTTVSAAIKQADPGAEVVLGSLTGAQAAAPGGFLDQLYALGAGSAFDTIAFNPYALNVKDVIQRIRDVRTIAAAHGDAHKPIRILEYGWATGGRSSTTVVTPACQAALIYRVTLRMAKLREELGLRSIVQFQWQDAPARTPASTAWPDYAGVRTSDGTAKPSRAALAAAIAGKTAPAGAFLTACPLERRAV